MARQSRTQVRAVKAGKASSLLGNKVSFGERVDIGSRYSLHNLTKHGESVLSMVEANNAEVAAHRDETDAEGEQLRCFADFGFNAHWIANVRAEIATLESTDAKVKALAADAMPTGVALNVAKTAVKEIRRDGVTVVSADPTRTSAMGTLGSGDSVPKLRKAIDTLVKLVPSYAVTPQGTGKEWIVEAKARMKALDAAEKVHTKALAALPPAAQQLHAKKGALQLEIKSVTRVARTVSPSSAHRFSLSAHVHTRTPSRKRPAKTGAPVATSGANAPATSSGGAK